jgi:hypothetical protein
MVKAQLLKFQSPVVKCDARRKKRLATVADLCIGKNRVLVHLGRKDPGQ